MSLALWSLISDRHVATQAARHHVRHKVAVELVVVCFFLRAGLSCQQQRCEECGYDVQPANGSQNVHKNSFSHFGTLSRGENEAHELTLQKVLHALEIDGVISAVRVKYGLRSGLHKEKRGRSELKRTQSGGKILLTA